MKSHSGKCFALIGIVLFLSMVVAPISSGNIKSSDQTEELFKTNIEIFDNQGCKSIPIEISSDHIKQLDYLFENTLDLLTNTNSITEQNAIIYSLIDYLYSQNILNDKIEIDSLKSLVTIKHEEKNHNIMEYGNNRNYNCTIIGSTQYTYKRQSSQNIQLFQNVLNSNYLKQLKNVFPMVAFLLEFIEYKFISSRNSYDIYIGRTSYDNHNDEWGYFQGYGRVFTNGDLGIKVWRHGLFGRLGYREYGVALEIFDYKGFEDFKGVLIGGVLDILKSRYIGTASVVGLSYSSQLP